MKKGQSRPTIQSIMGIIISVTFIAVILIYIVTPIFSTATKDDDTIALDQFFTFKEQIEKFNLDTTQPLGSRSAAAIDARTQDMLFVYPSTGDIYFAGNPLPILPYPKAQCGEDSTCFCACIDAKVVEEKKSVECRVFQCKPSSAQVSSFWMHARKLSPKQASLYVSMEKKSQGIELVGGSADPKIIFTPKGSTALVS